MELEVRILLMTLGPTVIEIADGMVSRIRQPPRSLRPTYSKRPNGLLRLVKVELLYSPGLRSSYWPSMQPLRMLRDGLLSLLVRLFINFFRPNEPLIDHLFQRPMRMPPMPSPLFLSPGLLILSPQMRFHKASPTPSHTSWVLQPLG